MLIKTFNIDKSKRLWIVILTAVCIAVLLILISFICIYNSKQTNNGIINKDKIFNLGNYYAEYDLTIFSNKNQNTYCIKEWYFNDNSNEKFRFDFENDNKEKITYMLSKNMLKITSNEQISNFDIENYGIDKKNLISVSTFLSLYNEIVKESKDIIFKIESNIVDDKSYYTVQINKTKINSNDENFKAYEFLLKDGLNIGKLELVIDNKKKMPNEYYVFNDDDEVIIGVKYTKFDIMDKFDEKIFANFNK